MRWIKIILIFFGGLALLGLMLIALVLLTFENEDYRRLVIRSVTHFTGYAVSVDGPFALNLSSEPSLTAQAIRFDAGPGDDPPPITTIGKLRIRIALWPLVTGTWVVRELVLEDVVMVVELESETEGDDHRSAGRQTPPDINIPIMERVRLQNIQLDVIDTAANRTVAVRLRQFSIDDVRDTGPLFIRGSGAISDKDFSIDGQLGALAAIAKGAEPYPVLLNISAGEFNVSVSGSVEDIVDGEGLALQLSGQANELSNFFELLKIDTPPLGELKFHATVTRDVAAPRVTDLSLTLSGDTRLEFAVNGDVDNAITGAGADLQFSGTCTHPEVFAWLLPADLPELQRMRVEGAVRETEGSLALEKLKIQVDAAQGLSAGAEGRIDLNGGIGTINLKDMDLDIALSMPSTDILRPYGIDVPTDVGPVSARGRLTGPLKRLALEDILFELGGSGPLRVTSRGRVGQLPTGPGADRRVSQIDLTFTLQADTTRSLAAVLDLDLPELGPASLNARMQGASDRFQLIEIDARTVSEQGLTISLSGRADLEMHPESGLLVTPNMQAVITAPTVAVAFAPFGATDLPDLKPFRAQARIGGNLEVLTLDNVTVSAGQSGPVRMEITGGIGRLPLDNQPAAGVKLEIVGTADSTAALSELLGVVIPDFGPLKATAQIDDRNGTYGARRLRLVIGDDAAPALEVSGWMASLFKADAVHFDGIDLTAVARNFSLQPLSELLGYPLPDLGALNGRFQVAGNVDQLTISQVDLATRSPQGLEITASGDIDRIRLQAEKPIAGVDLSLTATAPGWDALPVAAGVDLPDMGRLQIKAAIKDRSGYLDVEAFEIRSGTLEQDLLRLEGQFLRMGRPEQMALSATLETNSRPWTKHYLQRPDAVDVPLKGIVRATGEADGIRIDAVRLASADGERLTLNAGGRVRHLAESPTLELQLAFRAPDPPTLGPMLGVALPPISPVTINGRIEGDAQKASFSGKTGFGDTVFRSTVNAAFTAPRPLIVARFAAPSVHLEHLGIVPASPPEPPSVPPSDTQPATSTPLFDDTPLALNVLKNYDLIFSLDADQLVGKDIRIENVDLDITIDNGRLHVYPASMVYAAGFTEFDFTLDASGPTPVYDLKITGEDIDIEDLLARAHEPLILSGELSLVVDLQSKGRSKREMAANLGGEFSLALENGTIRRIVDFLSADALNLVFATADRRQHTNLNCLISKIQFQDGVGDIDIFFMDTPRIRSTAAGNIDLAAETVDVVINPQQKRRLLRRQASAVRIDGPLARPSIRVLPLAEAAALSGKILMPYVFLPERVLGNLWYLISKDQNASPCARELRAP